MSILSLDGIVEKQFPEMSYTWHWSPDDALILFGRLEGRHRPIFLLDVESGETTRLLSDTERSFFQGQFSPDGRWIAFQDARRSWQTTDLWTAPFRGAQPIPESEWVKISEDGTFADKIDYPTGFFPWSIAIGNLDFAGTLDLVTANVGGSDALSPRTASVLLNAGCAGRADYEITRVPQSVTLGDVDRDGALDIVSGDLINGVSVLRWVISF